MNMIVPLPLPVPAAVPLPPKEEVDNISDHDLLSRAMIMTCNHA